MTRPDYDDQVHRLRSIAEELTGYTWPTLADRGIIEADGHVVIEGQVEETPEATPEDAVKATPSSEVAVKDPFLEWEIRRAEMELAAFDKGAWADLQQGKVEALAGRVATLERRCPEWSLPVPELPRLERPVTIEDDIAARYDDTVRNTAVHVDVVAGDRSNIFADLDLDHIVVDEPADAPSDALVVAKGSDGLELMFWGPVDKHVKRNKRNNRKGRRRG
jgi:hypothetical protein